MLKYLAGAHSEKFSSDVVSENHYYSEIIWWPANMLPRCVFLTAGFPLLTAAQHVIDLRGDNWTVKNAQGNVSAPASLPSQVHLDLYAAGVIRK